MPASSSGLHQTRPRQSCDCPTTAHQRPEATHHEPFNPYAQPRKRTGHVAPLRPLATLELAAFTIKSASRRVAHTDSPPPTPTCRRSRPAPPTQHPHAPCLCQPTTATKYRVIVAAPDNPLPGSPNID